MTYSAYCDTMQHLEAFATTLHRSLTGGRKTRKQPQAAEANSRITGVKGKCAPAEDARWPDTIAKVSARGNLQ